MKTKVCAALVVLMAFLLLSGCSSVDYPRAHSISIDKDIHSFSYTADLRATHFLKKGDRYWILTEPAPDAAFSYDDEDNLDFAVLSFGGKGQDDGTIAEGTEDLPLTGRTSYVLLARELLFRLNEMAYNTEATPEQVMDMYAKVLDIIHEVAQAESSNIKHETTMTLNTGSSSALTLQESSAASLAATTGETDKPSMDKAEKENDNSDQ
jgi:ABC-type amino acid transport substrate-binding protein